MGTLTRSQLESEVRANLGNRTDLNARLVDILNIAQQQIHRFYAFSELDQEATGTLTYSGVPATDKLLVAPSGMSDVISFRLVLSSSESRKLQYVPYRVWDRLIPEPEYYSTGKPSHYTFWASQFEFWRVTDFAYPYRLRYRKYPTLFTSVSDVVSDFVYKDDIIIALATAHALISLGQPDEAAKWRNIGATMLNQAKDEDEKMTDFDIVQSIPTADTRTDYWTNPFIRGVPEI